MKALLQAILMSAHYDEELGFNFVEFNGDYYPLSDENIKEMERIINEKV